jgi:hypothetical protein
MKAYKFLRPGAVGPFSGVTWPAPEGDRPGAWVEAIGGLVACRTAVHACRIEHLPWWIQEELWEVELAEPVRLSGHKLLAPRGRLVRRVEGWDPAGAHAFSRACARHAADRAAAALEAAGAPEGADALRGAVELEVLHAVVGRLRPPEPARIAVQMAADSAVRAIGGHPATTAYIAAHAARHAAGPAAMAAERARQSSWLAGTLGLAW